MPERLKDRLWRLNNLYYIVNEKGEKVKFRLNMVQLKLYLNLWFLNLILKSRQHGITTFFCLYFLDACLFNSNVRAGIIAHNREDSESFFADKVKFAYDNLPEEIKAARPARSDSARELAFSNNSAIRVGTSMRSATLNYLHVSEHGKICAKYPDKAREIKTGALNTVHVGQFIAIESTAEGNSGDFHDMCLEAERLQKLNKNLSKLDFRFFFFPWYEDPRNQLDAEGVLIPSSLQDYFETLRTKHGIELTDPQKAWYAKKWKVQGDDMKREHPSTSDEAFQTSIQGAYFSSQFNRIYQDKRITSIPYEAGIPVDTWWDLGIDDTTAIWFTQDIGLQTRVIDYYENSGEGLSHYAQVLRAKNYEYGQHWAPHDITVRELGTGVSRLEKSAEYGLRFNVAPKLEKQDQIEAARSALGRCWFDEARCASGIKALENYRKEWDDRHGCYKNKPLHDWASNGADAFMTFAVAHSPAVTSSSRRNKERRRDARVV